MGNCPSVDVFYGFATQDASLIPDKDDDSYEPIFDHYEWQEEFYKRIGKPYPGWTVKPQPEIAEAGCIIDTHGYCDEPGLFLGIIGSHLHSDWDSIKVVDPSHFLSGMHPNHWDQKLQQFCELMGINFQKPQWLMVCSYG
jgi:hypothetical protein